MPGVEIYDAGGDLDGEDRPVTIHRGGKIDPVDEGSAPQADLAYRAGATLDSVHRKILTYAGRSNTKIFAVLKF